MSAETPPVASTQVDRPRRPWKASSVLAWLYLISLALLWVLSFAVGERNPLTALALYLPPLLWLAPAPFFVLFRAVRQRRRLFALIGIAIIVHLVWFMNWRMTFSSARPATSKDVLCIVTYNRGEEGKSSIQDFSADVRPDVIVFQDSFGRKRKFQNALKEYAYGEDAGDFTVLSKHPVITATALGEMAEPPKKVSKVDRSFAARFELDFHGRRIAVYTIHAMTPRHELDSYKRGAFLYGVLGLVPGTSWREKRQKMQRFWDARIADAEFVLEEIRNEKLPCVLAGDCNMIERGWLYRRFSALMTDAHAAKGSGYGCTMPGNTNNPVSLFRPWMRLDYIWAGSGWEVLHCETETHRQSQHLAVAAWLKLPPAQP